MAATQKGIINRKFITELKHSARVQTFIDDEGAAAAAILKSFGI